MAKMAYQELMEDFLAELEWEDELEIDEAEQFVRLQASLSLMDQSGTLFVEAHNDTFLVDVFIYFEGFRCKSNKQPEMAVLLNEIHRRTRMGRFVVLEDGRVRWQHRVDFEAAKPSGLTLIRIMGPGWDMAKMYLEPISAVALTKQSAAEAMAEFDAARDAENEVPDEL
jgi:hypothetical protein